MSSRDRRAERTELVVRTALDLVNAEGLEALTMRRLATALGMQLPTIYRLFDSKQALLDEMSEMILSRVIGRIPPPAGDWTHNAAAMARELRACLLAQRDGARIVGGNYASQQPTLVLSEAVLAITHEAGFSPEAALWANTTLFCYILGEVLEQQGASDVGAERLKAADSGAYPRTAMTTVEHFLDFDGRFEFGLRILLAGLSAELAKETSAKGDV
jgi:TetR/AcrR family transcriptional regulator, tetracycline repressor protein